MSDNKIILAGGSGFLGQELVRHFQNRGWEVITLTRKPSAAHINHKVLWDGQSVGPWAAALEGAKIVINLCEESVDCRVHPTRVLGQAISHCKKPPATWLNCSSATIYRHTFAKAWENELR